MKKIVVTSEVLFWLIFNILVKINRISLCSKITIYFIKKVVIKFMTKFNKYKLETSSIQ